MLLLMGDPVSFVELVYKDLLTGQGNSNYRFR